jgi:hypothetical protein
VTDGDYEMAAVWPAYRFPEPMAARPHALIDR